MKSILYTLLTTFLFISMNSKLFAQSVQAKSQAELQEEKEKKELETQSNAMEKEFKEFEKQSSKH